MLIAGLGVAGSVLAVYLLATGNALRAMAWPLVVVAVGQVALGVGLFLRTDPQVARLQEGQAESARMAKVNRSFRPILAAEKVGGAA